MLVGQNITPRRYAPLIDMRSKVDAAKLLGGLRKVIDETAGAMPTHADYIARHCRAPASVLN